MSGQILITGGGGYVGTRLVTELVSAGLIPLVTDKCPGTSLQALASTGKIRLIQCDLASFDGWVELCRDVEAVVYLAARLDGTDDVLDQGIVSVEQNVLPLITLLSYASNIRYICYVSSIGVYADPPVYSPIDEDHPTVPINTYGVTKLAAEQYVRVYGLRTGVPVTILRLCGVYGPGHYNPLLLPKRAVQNFIRRVAEGLPPVIRGDGLERRDHVYIDDVIQAIKLALQHRVTGVFNIATGKGATLLELARLVIDLLGSDLQPEVQGGRVGAAVRDYTLSIDRARREIGYAPQVSLRNGLAMEIAWYLQERNTPQATTDVTS